MQPANQDVGECCVEVFGGADELVVDVASGAAATNGIKKAVDGAEVAGAKCSGIAGEFSGVFKSLEAKRSGVAKLQFFVVEDLQDEHIVTALTERLQAAEEIVAIAEQV